MKRFGRDTKKRGEILMKKAMWKMSSALMLGLLLSIQAPFGNITPVIEVLANQQASIDATSLNIRSGAGTGHGIVATLQSGTRVAILGETTGSDGKNWYHIQFTNQAGNIISGYGMADYIKYAQNYNYNADFEANLTAQGFPESYKEKLRLLHAEYPSWVFVAQHTGLDWNDVIQNEALLGRNLVHDSSISSFKSTMPGAYNWMNSTWTGFDGSSWVAASEMIVRNYMDPRNFIDPIYIFQFLQQQYDPNVHTREGVSIMLKGTFMEEGAVPDQGTSGSEPSAPSVGPLGTTDPSQTGNAMVSSGPPPSSLGTNVSLSAPGSIFQTQSLGFQMASVIGPGGSDTSSSSGGPGAVGPGVSNQAPTASESAGHITGSTNYVDIIMNAAQQSGVNPYVIAAMIIQEQGSGGTSGLISGNYSGYEGYYNFFNVEAYQAGDMSAIQRGLWYASQSGDYGRPWDSPEKAIVGGAQFYAAGYINVGQDTFYLKKFNVQGNNLYKHQYMTNVQGAASEAAIFQEAYTEELKQTPLVFKIPVYQNMPELPEPQPVIDGSPNNKLSNFGAEGFQLTPTFNTETTSYDLIVDSSVTTLNIFAHPFDSTAQTSGHGTIGLQSGINYVKVSVRAENGDMREYTINIVQQAGGPTYHEGVNTDVVPSTSEQTPTTSESGIVGPGAGTSTPNQGPGGTNAVPEQNPTDGTGVSLAPPGA